MKGKSDTEADDDGAEYQDQQRRDHGAICPHREGYNDRHTHQYEAPANDMVDVDGDTDRWTADGQEQLKQRRCEQGHQQNQHARHQQVDANARPNDATDAVPC